MDGDVHGRGVEGFEHDLGHLFTIGFRVKWGFSEQDAVLFWGNTQLVVEGMMPDLLHIVPVGDDTVLNWVFQGEDTTFGLGFITDVRVFLTHTNHDTLMSWATDDRWEHGTWGIVSGKASLKNFWLINFQVLF